LVGLRDLLPGVVRKRRPKPPRDSAPRTIVPPREPDSPAGRIDAARDRLRQEIPPQADDERG
jgi:hypothetical protein